MIAITKEFKQLLQEMFESRGVTEIPANDLLELLSITIKELEVVLKDEQIRDSYKFLQASDGTYYVKRFVRANLEVKKMSSDHKIQWDNIGGCPCFTCYELDRCDIGNPISSVDCPLFTRWLFADEEDVEDKD
ncbi:MAG: hypothetical protein K9W42_03545 [Candidatus Heimdallarchaeota archaeon]|nr:hypothetical protein [Candidatus Heimdallarchaeota archaeon]